MPILHTQHIQKKPLLWNEISMWNINHFVTHTYKEKNLNSFGYSCYTIHNTYITTNIFYNKMIVLLVVVDGKIEYSSSKSN